MTLSVGLQCNHLLRPLVYMMLFCPLWMQGQGRVLVTDNTNESHENIKRLTQSKASTVTIELKDVGLEEAINKIVKQANMRVFYASRHPSLSNKVNVSAKEEAPVDVINRLLKGTGLFAVLNTTSDGVVIGTRVSTDSTEKNKNEKSLEFGAVSGIVKDGESGNVIEGVAISVTESNIKTVTDKLGRFRLTGLVPGEVFIVAKRLGYKNNTQKHVIKKGGEITVEFKLVASATSLNEVVTTATGVQRKLEMGNDVTVLKVDSLVRAAPVDNLSDLLATRVPGVYAMPTSGNPGAPTKIRIRGLSSVNQSNDPIIIVDGIRMASDQTNSTQNMAVNSNIMTGGGPDFLVSSPLDLIDINNVETLEVFKGPSAVALYGSDAANGVIVITTKRGKQGPIRYTANARFGFESIPGEWPINYRMYGHNNLDPTVITTCLLKDQVEGICTPDSLVSGQIVNDPEITPLGRGVAQSYSVGLSGGGGALMYALTGTVSNTKGMVKLSKQDEGILKESHMSIPSWVRNPESNTLKSLGINVGLEMGKRSQASWRSQLMHSATASSPLRNALNIVKSYVPAQGSSSSGLLSDIPNYRMKIGSYILKTSNSLDLKYNPTSILSTNLQAGGDWTFRNDKASLGSGECYIVTTTCLNTGVFNTGENIGTVLTSNARASLPVKAGRFLSLRNSVGLNWVRNQNRRLLVNASGLDVGATSGNNALLITQNQDHYDRITAGVYLESVIGIADRWYLPIAIRTDGGSALGSRVMPKFPKLGFSYLVSDDKWFSQVPGSQIFSMLRVRAAFGVAGVQPEKSSHLRTFVSNIATVDNSQIQYLTLRTIGNTNLRPERSREYELGIDIDILDQKMSGSITVYRKSTNDLIVNQSLPPSIAMATQVINLGDVRNTGIEVTLNVVPIDLSNSRLSSDIGFSMNRNILLRYTGRGVSNVKPGYPLFGYWAPKLLGAYDVNLDGYISSTEYVLSDSSYFLGTSYPSFTMSGNHSLTLFKNFTATALMQYEHNLTQKHTWTAASVRANSDPNIPLIVQAAYLYSDMNKIQTVSLFRLQEITFGYVVSARAVKSALRGRNLRISVQASNVAIWTNYQGKDPKVNGSTTEYSTDNGVVPTPRKWQLTFSIL